MGQLMGWIGSGLFLLSFFLLSKGKMHGQSYSYQLFQVLGAAGVGFSAFTKGAWPVLALEIGWACIAISTILSLWKKR